MRAIRQRHSLSLSLSLSLDFVCVSVQMYESIRTCGAFRETKLRDRANRRTVEHSGLRSLWELPRTTLRARGHVYSHLYYYAVVLFEMFK